jgi:hypothetical protein
MTGRRSYHAGVGRRRPLHGITPVLLLLLLAVSPAVHAQPEARRAEVAGSAAVRHVDASLTGISAAVAERVPVPTIWPLQGTPTDGIAVLVVLAWFVLVLAGVVALDRAGHVRRDRAPPRSRGLVFA